MRRNFLLFAIVSVATVVGAVVLYHLFQPYMRARNLLSQVSTLQVGSSSFEDAERVGKRLGSPGNDPCLPVDCYWTFSIDNFKVPTAWRGEGTRFVAGFRVQNSVVTEQRFMFQIGTGFNPQTAEFWERQTWPHYPKQFIVGTQTTENNPHYRSYVKLTPAASADVRKRYLSFNFSCLWKYGGCKDAQELLPTVDWKSASQELQPPETATQR
jgi:hypothetical protein